MIPRNKEVHDRRTVVVGAEVEVGAEGQKTERKKGRTERPDLVPRTPVCGYGKEGGHHDGRVTDGWVGSGTGS